MLEDTLPARTKNAARTDVRDLPIERFPQVHVINRVAGKTDTFAYLVETLIAGIAATRKGRSRRKPVSD